MQRCKFMNNQQLQNAHKYPLPPFGFVNYIDHLGSDFAIVQAARQSYGGQSRGEEADHKLLNSLYRRRHTSPFEQVSITYHIRMPIFVMRQFVRHRTARLNEFSMRYKQPADEFYLPKGWRVQHDTEKQMTVEADKPEEWHEEQEARARYVYLIAMDTYKAMVADGVCREQARMVLPLAIYTEITVNIDLHNLMGFFRQRLDLHAQGEIRDVAEPMAAIATTLFPWTMGAFRRYKFTIEDLEP